MANEGGSQKSKVIAALIVGMVLGIAGAGFVAWYVVEKNPASFSNATQRENPKPLPPELPPSAIPVSAPVAASAVSEVQHYEFYKVLPDKVEGGTAHKQPAIKTQPSVTSTVKQPAKVTDSTTYYVQASAFQNSDDAEKLKAKLAISGMEASIQKAEVAGKGTWYRVRLGPFKGRDEAEAAVTNLKQSGINNAAVLHAQ